MRCVVATLGSQVLLVPVIPSARNSIVMLVVRTLEEGVRTVVDDRQCSKSAKNNKLNGHRSTSAALYAGTYIRLYCHNVVTKTYTCSEWASIRRAHARQTKKEHRPD